MRRMAKSSPSAGARPVTWCATDQKSGNTQVAPFSAIAKEPGFDTAKLALYLLLPHPKMPDMNLTRSEAADLTAYIVSRAVRAVQVCVADHREGSTDMYRFLESTAAQYMTRDVKSVTRQRKLAELETLFAQYDFDALPVVEGGKLMGIVTKFDFLRAFGFTTGQLVPSYDELMKRTVGEVMTEGVVHVEPTTPLTRVLQLMVSLKLRSFPVLGPDRELLGMISRGDVMRALKQATQDAR